ncbi:hypothetical protein A9G41_02905 [Gilliamella sp. Nev5-1]|uniref:Abi family protein n=1 Tax=unclassified Gilliamella TaxID=2685620 RepID=UPI00080E9B1B|nr:Abi family protein [Gilliamella apicola]OCG58357.1 hypothetical protein A9G40_09780 [Gilliamella apicola]OCG71353.1 hypothetical protein A9G41_02905 [Gilliamella apicola]
MANLKPHLSYEDQLIKLENRGMIFSDLDRKQAQKKLANVGYYRLSGYWYPFRKLKIPPPSDKLESRRNENFIENTLFSNIYKLYLFDVKLRNIIFLGLERIETYLKAIIAYELGKISPTAYKDKKIIDNNSHDKHDNWLNNLNILIDKNKSNDCIKWNIEKYNEIPIWAIVEIWNFGTMSKFYGILDDKYKVAICKSMKFLRPNSKNVKLSLKTSLEYLNIIRNRCAHHVRLWNTSVSNNKINLEMFDNLDLNVANLNNDSPELYRIAGIIYMIWSFTLRISEHSDWLETIVNHINDPYYVNAVKYSQMGFNNGSLIGINNLLKLYKQQTT